MSAAHDLAEMGLPRLAAAMRSLPGFSRFVEIATEEDGVVDFRWNRWWPEQRAFEWDRTGRDIVVKPRQLGFSMLELARDLQFARTHEGARVVVVVHTDEAKRRLFQRVRRMARSLQAWGLAPEPNEDTTTSLSWADLKGSSIEIVEAGANPMVAEDRGRSGTINRLHCTEVAYYKAATETMAGLLNAVGQRETVIESTANGTTGIGRYFYEQACQAREGAGGFTLHFYPWWQHHRYRANPAFYSRGPKTEREARFEAKLRGLGCDDEQIAFWRSKVAETNLQKALRDFPPDFDDAFEEGTERWIDREYIDTLRQKIDFAPTPWPLEHNGRSHGHLRISSEPRAGVAYMLIVDPSGGTGGDEAAMKVMEVRSGHDIASWHSTRTKPGELGHLAAKIGRYFRTALIVVERNEWKREGSAEGKETIHVLEREERYPRLYRHDDGNLGWSTNGATRPLIWGDLFKMIIDELVWTPDARTIDEAAALVIDDDGRPRAKGKGKAGGSDDGLWVCWGIGHQVRQRLPGGGFVAASGENLVSVGLHT